ncbi:FeoA family protein [Botrimarina hoheduenensis]|uniref:FeoA domain protein n=1 Tax=Botrimarina hoheduenensis TaxID=2528000 RepID=A0A5C5WBB6_9BACT|nr:FeoA domain-containing protein [Botrimarina hoheduenensis]TWT46912.1 FeoA domain protein [Botrimarina hoheduenensis]
MPASVVPAEVRSTVSTAEVCMSQLGVGSRARVARIVGDSQDVVRLKALGVCEGRWVEVLRQGDAWVLRVLGSRIGVSRRLIDSVRLFAA